MKTEWIFIPFLKISMESLISWNFTSIWLLRMRDPTWQNQPKLEYNRERKSSEFRLLLGSEYLSPTPSQHSKAPSVSSCVSEMFGVQNAPVPSTASSSRHLADLNTGFLVSQMPKAQTNIWPCRAQIESGFISMESNLHGFPGLSFCASALEKRGPFQMDCEVNSDGSFPYSKTVNREALDLI